jgi:outer membrane protein OmpA-like peptidoglycan-associated protein
MPDNDQSNSLKNPEGPDLIENVEKELVQIETVPPENEDMHTDDSVEGDDLKTDKIDPNASSFTLIAKPKKQIQFSITEDIIAFMNENITSRNSASSNNNADENIQQETDVANTVATKFAIELLENSENRNLQRAALFFPYTPKNPVLTTEVTEYFSKTISWMKLRPKNKITLFGHTDNIGTKKENLAKGVGRVMVIRELLINMGAPMAQIDVISKGESQPIADNDTEKGRNRNRRVEVFPR